MRNPGKLLSTVTVVLTGVAGAVIITLFVTWALEDVIYFSLFVGIPAGMVFGVLSSVLIARHLKRSPKGST